MRLLSVLACTTTGVEATIWFKEEVNDAQENICHYKHAKKKTANRRHALSASEYSI